MIGIIKNEKEKMAVERMKNKNKSEME